VGSNPTLSAIRSIVPSLLIVFTPTRVWANVRERDPRWTASLFMQALPFSLVPAAAWPSASTVVLSLLAVVVLALGFFALSPWFAVPRSWDRSMALAAYASTPVLASSFLLLFPAFAVVTVAALLHCFALCYLGVQQVLGCRESEAALLVAAAWIFSAVGSMLLGGLCAAAGLL
jgi:Yip1-like protein